MRGSLWALGGTLVLMAVGPAAASAQGPPPITLTGGYADWGLKQSFRSYIKGPIAHGSFTASDGATVNADETFRFTLVSGSYDLAQHAVVSQFDGTVHFLGHNGLLDLTISDPKIVTTGDTGKLYLDARSKSLATGAFEDFDDVEFAALDLTGSAVVPSGTQISIAPIASKLTGGGAAAFAGFYAADTVLDPVAMNVSFTPPSRPTTPQPSAPEVQPESAVEVIAASRLTSLTRPWNRNRKAAVARVACRTGSCAVEAPRQIRFEVGGERYHPVVIAPEQLEQGERGTVRIRLSRRALAALAGQRATSTLRFVVRSGDHTDFQTLQLTLRSSGVTVNG
jgi:Htaa protein